MKKLFNRKQEFALMRGKRATPIGKAQAKILLTVCYYIALGIFVLTSSSYYLVVEESTFQAVTTHFTCQSTGIQSGRDCGDIPNADLAVFDSLSAVGVILIGLLPAVVLVFTVKCNCNKKCCK